MTLNVSEEKRVLTILYLFKGFLFIVLIKTSIKF